MQAKQLGARWDTDKRLWYSDNAHVQQQLSAHFQRCNTAPVNFVGEDRGFGGNGLFVDLIPSTAWYANVRSMVHPCEWDRVRRHVYERASFCCECCGVDTRLPTAGPRGQGTQLEAHERWHYDEASGVQRLMRLVALCTECHEVTHMGLAEVRSQGEAALQHLMRVAGISRAEAMQRRNAAFELWAQRSSRPWAADISMLTDAGIQTLAPSLDCAAQQSDSLHQHGSVGLHEGEIDLM